MIVLVICFIIYMFPFVMVVINSFKTKRDIIKEPLSLIGTNGASVANYVEAFTKMNFPRTFMNSLCVTGISVLLIIVVSSMCAYIFVRTDYKLNKIFFSLMIASMVIPFQVIMIPLVSIYGGQLHLLNHRMTLILMHVGFFNGHVGIHVSRLYQEQHTAVPGGSGEAGRVLQASDFFPDCAPSA